MKHQWPDGNTTVERGGGLTSREINVPKIIAVPNATLCGTYTVKRSKQNLPRNVPRFNVLPQLTFNLNYPVIPAFFFLS